MIAAILYMLVLATTMANGQPHEEAYPAGSVRWLCEQQAADVQHRNPDVLAYCVPIGAGDAP